MLLNNSKSITEYTFSGTHFDALFTRFGNYSAHENWVFGRTPSILNLSFGLTGQKVSHSIQLGLVIILMYFSHFPTVLSKPESPARQTSKRFFQDKLNSSFKGAILKTYQAHPTFLYPEESHSNFILQAVRYTGMLHKLFDVSISEIKSEPCTGQQWFRY